MKYDFSSEKSLLSPRSFKFVAMHADFDILAHVDSDKLGLWDGGMLDLFAESRLGQSIDHFASVFSPTNLAMFFPVPDQQITAITGLKYRQAITDNAGAGYYHLGPSDQAKGQITGLRDEDGVELFYSMRIVPGCHLTTDMQVLHPGLVPVATALVLGLRLKIDF